MVHLGRSEELSKLVAEFRDFLRCDTFATIADLNPEHAKQIIIANDYTDEANSREFESVLDEIDQYLLETKFIAIQLWRKINLYKSVVIFDAIWIIGLEGMHSFNRKINSDTPSLEWKHLLNTFYGLQRIESCNFLFIFLLFDHFQVNYVTDKIEKQF